MFLERPGERSFAPPYRATNARLNGFVLRGNRDEMQRLCDRSLNWPGVRRPVFEAMTASVLLTVERMEVRLPAGVAGVLPVREVAVWIPVQHPGGLGFFLPYVYIDTDYGLFTGRDALGFPKSYAEFPVFADNFRRPDSFAADVFALRRFAATERLRLRRLLEIESTVLRSAPPLPEESADFEEPAREIARQLLGGFAQQGRGPVHRGEIAGRVFSWLTRTIPLILLKEHRDAEAPQRACFRRLVSVPAKVDRVRGLGWLPDRYTVRCADLESEPLHLLIPEQSVEWPRAFYLDFDFSISSGAYLHAG